MPRAFIWQWEMFFIKLGCRITEVRICDEKLKDTFEQNKDSKGAEQFQQALDEDAELIDSVLTRTSELKVLKVELERVCK